MNQLDADLYSTFRCMEMAQKLEPGECVFRNGSKFDDAHHARRDLEITETLVKRVMECRAKGERCFFKVPDSRSEEKGGDRTIDVGDS